MQVEYHRSRNLITYMVWTGSKNKRIQVPLRGPAEGHTPFWERPDRLVKNVVARIAAMRCKMNSNQIVVTISK
jgi:hypothetical protein